MAIYIRGIKLEDNNEYVIYAYGEKHEELTGKIKFYKSPLKLEIVKYQYDFKHDSLAFGIAWKIKDFYLENDRFPDEISKQS